MYVQHACTQPVSVQPALKKWRSPEIGFRWLFLRSGPGATNHFEAGGFCRSNDEVDYPNLMFHFLPARDPLRRLAAGGRPRLPGAHRPDELERPRVGEDHVPGSGRQAGAPVQLPLHRPGPARVGRGDRRRPEDPRAARIRRVRRRRDLTGALCADRRRDPRLGPQGRRDGASPVVQLQDGNGRARRRRPGDDGRPRRSTGSASSTPRCSRSSRMRTSMRR